MINQHCSSENVFDVFFHVYIHGEPMLADATNQI